jgi:hypothetical protein
MNFSCIPGICQPALPPQLSRIDLLRPGKEVGCISCHLFPLASPVLPFFKLKFYCFAWPSLHSSTHHHYPVILLQVALTHASSRACLHVISAACGRQLLFLLLLPQCRRWLLLLLLLLHLTASGYGLLLPPIAVGSSRWLTGYYRCPWQSVPGLPATTTLLLSMLRAISTTRGSQLLHCPLCSSSYVVR